MTGLTFGGLVTLSLFVFTHGAPTAQPWRQCGVEGKMTCPTGYTCEPITAQYSQCVQDGVVQLRRRQASTAVTGAIGGVVDRQPVHTYAQRYPREFNMFILGLSEMMNQAETDQFSYYEIAGIHGAPFKSWGGEPNPQNPPQMGYCTHSSALFATWHRPYLALLEQRIAFNALQVAERFTGEDAQAWKDAAARVRLPFWDWSDAGLAGALPAAITAPQVSVQAPDGQKTIPNPLYSYRFSSNRKNTDFRFQSFRDSAETRRQPPRDMSRSNNLAVEVAMRAGYSARRQNTYNLFSINRFNAFSNRAFRDNSSPDQLVSVESIHDEVHVAAGGNYGHMTYLEFSAFDPIFHIHHCNVDRLVAIYQAIHPGLNVEPQQMATTFAQPDYVDGQMDTIDTPLYPFRKTDGTYYTSQDVSSASSVWALGYGYPEVPASYQGRSQEELQTYARSRVDALYGPNGTGIQEVESSSSSATVSSTAAPASSSSATGNSVSGSGSATATSSASSSATDSALASPSVSLPSVALPSSSSDPATESGSIAAIEPTSSSSSSPSSVSSAPTTSSTSIPPVDNSDVSKAPLVDPNSVTAPPRREYILHCLFDQSELSGATQLLFFFGEVPKVSSPAEYATASNLIGTASWFSANLMKMRSKTVSATVPLTDNLKKAGISLDVDEAVDYLEDNLSWVVVNAEKEVQDVKSLKIGVSSCDTKYIGGLANFGKWETHYQVTDKKPNGMKEEEAAEVKVDTDKAPRVTIKRGKEKWAKFENNVKEKMGIIGEDVKDKVDEVREVFEGVVDGLKSGLEDLFKRPQDKERAPAPYVPKVPTKPPATAAPSKPSAPAAPSIPKTPVDANKPVGQKPADGKPDGYGDKSTPADDDKDCEESEKPDETEAGDDEDCDESTETPDDAQKPDESKPDVSKPDVSKPDMSKPDVSKPESGKYGDDKTSTKPEQKPEDSKVPDMPQQYTY